MPDRTDASADLGRLVNHVARLFRQAMARETATFGLTAQQAAVMLTLGADRMPIGEIAERLGMDRPTMTGVAERLVRDSWASLEANPSDGRSRMLALAQRGLEVLPALDLAASRVSEAASRALSSGDRDRLVGLLTALAEGLAPA